MSAPEGTAAMSTQRTAAPSDDTRRRYLPTLLRPVDAGAATVALIFWIMSLRPSLLPRPAAVQGLISAICLLVGYGLAGLAVLAFRAQRRRTGWFRPDDRLRRIGRWSLAGSAVVAFVVGTVAWVSWQNDQRAMVSLSKLGGGASITMIGALVVATAILFALARTIGFVVGRLDRWLTRRVPRVAAHAIVTALIVVVLIVFTNHVVIDKVIAGTATTFAAGDTTTEPGVAQPTSELRSGGPGSLVPWDTLGRQGRTFVAGATPMSALTSFAGPAVTVHDPIRVYVGLDSAPTLAQRADLAVAELERTGAFDRRVLCVVAVTGTGWINPVAAAAFEYVRAGDTAMVGLQYSYLPSWLATLADAQAAGEAGRALNDAVYAHWSQLPADSRPQLVVYGESLGSYGSEEAFLGPDVDSSLHAVTTRTEGALWIAPTNDNPVWDQVTAARDPASPIWRPVYQDGRQVVVVNEPDQLPIAEPGAPAKVIYAQHASDPVTWWEPSIAWSRPEWTRAPRGPDVPDTLGWFPFVTWLQVTGDLVEGFNTPPGHGHNFNDVFGAGFASLMAPPGWTPADTARLDPILAQIADGEPSY